MEGVKPESVIEVLKGYNVHISLEQAQLILIFMYKLARISLPKNETS